MRNNVNSRRVAHRVWDAIGLRDNFVVEHILIIEFNCVAFQYLEILVAKGLPAMVFALRADITLDFCHLRLADREGTIASLPFKLGIYFALLIDPSRRVAFEQLNGFGNSKSRMGFREKMPWSSTPPLHKMVAL